MLYIIMCGGEYMNWEKPRQLIEINGETVVARTIRLLKENGVTDIAISTHCAEFKKLNVPILWHQNSYYVCDTATLDTKGYWCDGFYPTTVPVCYIFGDVVFSPEAIKTIVNTDTDSVEFFASSPPFSDKYPKAHAEPFAVKVVDTDLFNKSIKRTKQLTNEGAFGRKPIMWELWQVIKGTPLNEIDFKNYVAINDYTCDIDEPEDIEKVEGLIDG